MCVHIDFTVHKKVKAYPEIKKKKKISKSLLVQCELERVSWKFHLILALKIMQWGGKGYQHLVQNEIGLTVKCWWLQKHLGTICGKNLRKESWRKHKHTCHKMNERENKFNQTPSLCAISQLSCQCLQHPKFGSRWGDWDKNVNSALRIKRAIQHLYLLWATLVHGCPAGCETEKAQSPQRSLSAGVRLSPRPFLAL